MADSTGLALGGFLVDPTGLHWKQSYWFDNTVPVEDLLNILGVVRVHENVRFASSAS